MARIPLNGNPRVTSKHGEPTGMGYFGKHLGVDWGVGIGTPVYAPANGVIKGALYSASLGNYLEAEFLNLTWRFAHFKTLAVRTGQTVKEGDLLGYSGNTGVVTGPHLHVDCRLRNTLWNAAFNNYRDPIEVVNTANAKNGEGYQVGDKVWLKGHVKRWRIYKPGVRPIAGNEFATLKPAQFKEGPGGQGGLIYTIKGTTPHANTFLIQTQMFGDAWIYLDEDAQEI